MALPRIGAHSVSIRNHTPMTAKQLTRIGVFHIEQAILDTLFQSDDEYVRAAEIARELGLRSWDRFNWIVSRILYKIEKDERVEARHSPNRQISC